VRLCWRGKPRCVQRNWHIDFILLTNR